VVANEWTEEADGAEFAARRDNGTWLGGNGAFQVIVCCCKDVQVVLGSGFGPLELECSGKERRDRPGEGSVQEVVEDRRWDASGWKGR
jgi:hypothetical protein